MRSVAKFPQPKQFSTNMVRADNPRPAPTRAFNVTPAVKAAGATPKYAYHVFPEPAQPKPETFGKK